MENCENFKSYVTSSHEVNKSQNFWLYIYIWKVGEIIIVQVAKPTFMLMVGHWQILFRNYLVLCLEVRIEFQFKQRYFQLGKTAKKTARFKTTSTNSQSYMLLLFGPRGYIGIRQLRTRILAWRARLKDKFENEINLKTK